MPDSAQRVLTGHGVLAGAAAPAVLAVSVLADEWGVALAVALGGLVLAAGWPTLLGLPSPRGVTAVLAASAVAAPVAAAVPGPVDLRWVAVVAAVSLIGSFLHQLLRSDGRARLVATVSGTALGIGLLCCGAAFVAAVHYPDGGRLIIAVALAVVVGSVLAAALGQSQHEEWVLPIAMLGGAVAAVAIGVASAISAPVLFAIGALSAAVSHAVRRVLTQPAGAGWPSAQWAMAVATTLSTGAVAYLAGWLIQR
ncbi:hypothetical protein ACMYYO_13340 [Dermacoccaceae bacterium W4C1]